MTNWHIDSFCVNIPMHFDQTATMLWWGFKPISHSLTTCDQKNLWNDVILSIFVSQSQVMLQIMFGKSVFVGYVPYDKCVISMIYCLISLAKTYYSQWDYYNWLVSIAALQYKYHCYFLSMVQKTILWRVFISGGDEKMVGDFKRIQELSSPSVLPYF